MPLRPQTLIRRAAGNKINALLAVVLVVIAYVGYVFLKPEIVAYEITGVMKVSCNTFMREIALRADASTWEKTFVRRVRQAGVKQFHPDQYEFTLSEVCNLRKSCSCDAQAVFEVITPWPIIGTEFQIAPRRTVHRRSEHVDYRATY